MFFKPYESDLSFHMDVPLMGEKRTSVHLFGKTDDLPFTSVFFRTDQSPIFVLVEKLIGWKTYVNRQAVGFCMEQWLQAMEKLM